MDGNLFLGYLDQYAPAFPDVHTDREAASKLPAFSRSSLDKLLIAVILNQTCFSKRCQSELNSAAFPSIYLFIYPYLSVLFNLVVLRDKLLAFRLTFKMKSIIFLKKNLASTDFRVLLVHE